MIKISLVKNFLCTSLSPETVLEYTSFEDNFFGLLNEHLPLKMKGNRENHVPYATQTLRKAIMERSYLEKLYLKNKTTESLKKYKKHNNFL